MICCAHGGLPSYEGCQKCISERIATAVAEARCEERDHADALAKACRSAMSYFEMLEKATGGIEHGNLREIRAALAAYRAGKESVRWSIDLRPPNIMKNAQIEEGN